MPEEELPAHLAGVRALASGRCDLADEGLINRIEATEQVLDVVIEPAPDNAGKTVDLVASLARYGHGVTFDGIRFRDGDGRGLATRREAAPGRATPPPEPRGDEVTGSRARIELDDGLPSAQRVLARAWVISAVALRAFLEEELRWIATEQVDKLRRWLGDVGADLELEP